MLTLLYQSSVCAGRVYNPNWLQVHNVQCPPGQFLHMFMQSLDTQRTAAGCTGWGEPLELYTVYWVCVRERSALSCQIQCRIIILQDGPPFATPVAIWKLPLPRHTFQSARYLAKLRLQHDNTTVAGLAECLCPPPLIGNWARGDWSAWVADRYSCIVPFQKRIHAVYPPSYPGSYPHTTRVGENKLRYEPRLWSSLSVVLWIMLLLFHTTQKFCHGFEEYTVVTKALWGSSLVPVQISLMAFVWLQMHCYNYFTNVHTNYGHVEWQSFQRNLTSMKWERSGQTRKIPADYSSSKWFLP